MGSTDSLNLDNIQGDILGDGLPKLSETFLFFTINDPRSFCQRLNQVSNEIASTTHVKDLRSGIANNAGGGIVPAVGANIAFSCHGLQKVTCSQASDLNTQDPAFDAGMKAGAASLADPLRSGSSDPAWEDVYLHPENVHGVILAAGSDDGICSQKLQTIMSIFGPSAGEVHRVSGKVRPGEMKGHEHFGYMDGVSQPAVQGIDTATPGQDIVSHGTFICGRNGDRFASQRPAWMIDGSFLCFRKLQQNVQDWNKFLVDASNQLGTWSDQLGSRLVGRWKSGCPIQLSPDFDDRNLAADPNRVNKFDFDSISNDFRCPMGAHIRKTNPRGDLGRATVNQFRILRRGIPYGNEVDADPTGERGLLFVCYQSNISQGFKFIQETWANQAVFASEGAGVDAIMGQSNSQKTINMRGLYPQDASRPLALSGINRFVVPKGGEYFFSPSMSALKTTLSTVREHGCTHQVGNHRSKATVPSITCHTQ
ncbi:hypothetical protein BAUCODRAFT_571758 [Baudoinia panamericana UAMH 10762]|uniref:Dyp-type peroxidase n=1 Tax=Baudoinia panamericana (strain UAMH 10762) TaxID=717646 RepID=M2LY18_BAUPA|nr:uncharacterized protein BAUCODRAFT_571758 [Baudoinia panamericana UAMH 10762]EMC99592.1 hypothetical protein BAUCODRAFT_571758 [Baudoinia panamericana UAMH 10762]